MRRSIPGVGSVFDLLLWPIRAARAYGVLRRGGYVSLTIDGSLVELSTRRPWYYPRQEPKVSVARVRSLVDEICKDPKADGLIVDVRSLHAGAAAVTSLRQELLRLRAAGKALVVHLPLGAGSREMLLASAATRVVVGPQSSVLPLGVAVEVRYFRRALDRLGILPEIFARGEFKTAGEALARDSMSAEQREQLGALLDTMHEELTNALASGRGVPKERVLEWIDQGPYRAKEAVSVGLVDEVAYEDELPERLALPAPGALPAPVPESKVSVRVPFQKALSKGKADDKMKARILPGAIYLGARRGLRLARRSSRYVGVVNVRGPIVSRSPLSMGNVAVDERVILALTAARKDARVEGVVLFVDSPGGSALASDRIYHHVAQLAEHKPVVAYFSNVAASGGYYVAAGAHAIVAQPTTVTGSIGVVAAHLVIGPLLEKLGVVTELVKRGARSDMMSSTRKLDEGERAALDREIDGFYRDFVGIVARGRGRAEDEIEKLARGRVYSGRDAHAKGLVDVLGGFEQAVDEVRTRAGDHKKRLQPQLIVPPRTMPKAPELPAPFVNLLTRLPLLHDSAVLLLGTHSEERVLAFSPLSLDTW